MSMKNMVGTLFLLFIGNTLFAQSATIYFETAEYELTAEAKAELNTFKKMAISSPTARINLVGHTDRTGHNEYNEDLSKRRSAAVANYLIGIGVTNQFNIDWKGENQIISKDGTDLSKAKNRRVTLELSNEVAPGSSFFSEFRKEPEVKIASATTETNLAFSNGTEITIRPNDLELIDLTAPIEVEVEEYYQKGDFVLANLTTTTTSGKLLESKGMVNIVLKQNGEPIALKTGTAIPINFPDRSEGDKTILFTGVERNNAIKWKAQGSKGLSGSWTVGKSYMFDENHDTVFISKERMITVNNEAFREKKFYEKGILTRIDTTSMENEIAAMNAIAASTDLGWINCDRFYDSEAKKVDFLVELPKDTPAHVMLVFKDINSVVSYSHRLRNQYTFSNIPEGMNVEIIAFVEKDEMVDFGRQLATTAKKTIAMSTLTEVNKENLPELLSDL
ncbi:MAG: hypothetical protein ACI865_001485 [Flavobacteriaceae bacterium]|jgi:hypothetical protein